MVVRHRPRGGNGDDAARRASDAALQVPFSMTMQTRRRTERRNTAGHNPCTTVNNWFGFEIIPGEIEYCQFRQPDKSLLPLVHASPPLPRAILRSKGRIKRSCRLCKQQQQQQRSDRQAKTTYSLLAGWWPFHARQRRLWQRRWRQQRKPGQRQQHQQPRRDRQGSESWRK